MSISTNSLRHQLQAYETWLDEHDDAMEAWELDGWLRIGLSLLDWIKGADEHWSKDVRSGTLDWLGPESKEIRALYQGWLDSCEAVLHRIRAIESNGYKVEDAARFRDAYRRTRLLLCVEPAALAEAEESLKAGRGRSLGEVRDAIYRGHL